MSVGAVILAAGFSRRLGRPKQDVVLNGETLLARAVRLAGEAALSPVYVVVRDPKWLNVFSAAQATVLLNDRAHEGMATSVVLGVQHAQRQALQGVVLMTCDQPVLTPAHLRALCARPTQVTASQYAGRNGVPAYFPAAVFEDLLHLQRDAGARHLLQQAHAIPNEALSLDIDTEEDLRAAQAQFSNR